MKLSKTNLVEQILQVASTNSLLKNTYVKNLALFICASLILTLAAKISIPIGPVPITMQTLAILVLGACLGKHRAALASLLYLTEGLLGAPVFATPLAGFAAFASPTFGFLLAMPFAAYLAGLSFDLLQKRKIFSFAFFLILAHQIVFFFGVSYLALMTSDLEAAIRVAYLPFVGIDFIKISLAAASFVMLSSYRKSKIRKEKIIK